MRNWTTLGLNLAVGAWLLLVSFTVDAQATTSGKVWRIGFLRVGALPINQLFWQAMEEHSLVQNQNVKVEPRYADRVDQLPALAAELVKLNVDLIITNGSPATLAAKQATRTIPIVFFLATDPVQRGIVVSMARPGGNATGFAYGLYDHKLLEILKEAFPRLSRVAYPILAGETPEAEANPELPRAAAALRLQLQGVAVHSLKNFGAFYADARKAGVEAVLIHDSPSFVPSLPQLGAEATNARMPAIAFTREFCSGGGLLCYGPAAGQHWRQLAGQIDKILSGANPGDLPVEQPTKFELTVNLKAAKALGIAIPQAVLIRAHERIQ